MKILDLGHWEAQFGLMIREKENHDNYALLRFEDLDKVIGYYNSFKEEFDSKSNEKKRESTQEGIENISDVQNKVVKAIKLLDKKSENSKKSEAKKQ